MMKRLTFEKLPDESVTIDPYLSDYCKFRLLDTSCPAHSGKIMIAKNQTFARKNFQFSHVSLQSG